MVDLPTPPLPEATQTMFLTWASAPSGRRWRPSDCCSRPFSCWERTSKPTVTRETPSRAPTRSVTACWKWLRIGQPGVVHLDRADHPELDDRAPQLRIDDARQSLCDLFLGRRCHVFIVAGRPRRQLSGGSRAKRDFARNADRPATRAGRSREE